MSILPPHRSVIVLGAGVFGLPAALALRARGWDVELIDPGPIPHPDAASTDVSKIIRMDYGSDAFYADLAERAMRGWARWNEEWGWRAFERVGFLVLAPSLMLPGEFEYESYQTAVARVRDVSRLTDDETRRQFRIWPEARYPDGYINRDGGWSPSGRVIEALLHRATRAGVRVREGRAMALGQTSGGRPEVHLDGGEVGVADRVVVAAGAWTPVLLPELADRIVATGHEVFHLRVNDPAHFQPPHFVPWAAATASTGWYGFPALPDGRLKLAQHGPGRILDPEQPREVDPDAQTGMREFVRQSLPELLDAPVVYRRLCVYTDTFDSDFFVDDVPGREGVVVATGGSGHGFKFAPVLGDIVADVVEGTPNPQLRQRFQWRELGERKLDPARFAG